MTQQLTLNLFTLAQNINLNQIADWRGSTLEWSGVFIGAFLFVVALFSVNYLFQFGNISRATSMELIRQPIFLMLLGSGMLVMLINIWIPFFSLGDDTKIYIDCCLSTILISSVVLAVWTASLSVTEEVEGKTALTLLSKPITRQQFILGKYIGIVQAIAIMIIALSVFFILTLPYKCYYDTREAGLSTYDEGVMKLKMITLSGTGIKLKLYLLHEEIWWIICRSLPSLFLTFMEAAVMAGVSVAISTRLPMVVNIVTCLAVFVIGHILPIMVNYTQATQQLEFVAFIAKVFAVIFPVTEVFNSSGVVSMGRIVPPVYILVAMIYCVCYCAATMILSFLLFEDRDLA